ncbi:hypothetical protein [Neobacillus soli]|uniref:hypothetical protein n=1 Tax=Neobacillus soli TaxID=220688 RepID=UPI000AF4750E|nr:hypothetical protein [Neobacillus soli]
MDVKTQVKILVQQVVEAYLKEKWQENREQSIVILLSYQSPNPAQILQAVTPLLEGYDVTLILSKEWLPATTKFSGKSYVLLEETSQQKLMAIIEKTAVLVVPAASYQLVSKLALTMDDELAVWLAIQYQLLGKPIVIANNDIELNVYQQIHAPHSVQERMQSYIRQIQTDQVKWVPLSKMSQMVKAQYAAYEEKQTLILAKHVEKAFQDGLKEIIVPVKSKVTPSAKDLAKDLKIQINPRDSLQGGTL